MHSKEELFINEMENYNPPNILLYAKNNEAISIIKSELDKLVKEFRIVMKVGKFAEFLDSEAPQLMLKIQNRKNELEALIEYEKTKIKPLIAAAERVTKPAPVNSQSAEEKQRFFLRNLFVYSDYNLYTTVLVGLLIVGLQLIINLTIVGRARANLQNSVIEPLTDRLKSAEAQNNELSKNIAYLQKQIVFLQNANLKMPILSKIKVKPKYSQVRKDSRSKFSRN